MTPPEAYAGRAAEAAARAKNRAIQKAYAPKKAKRKKAADPAPGEDALSLGAAIVALVQGAGHGGLSRMAETLGMTVSALRKRLQRPGAGMDDITMKAVIHVAQSRSELSTSPVIESQTIGQFIIERRADGSTTWRKAE